MIPSFDGVAPPFADVTRAEMASLIATMVLPSAKAMVGIQMWILASHVVVCLRHAQPTQEENQLRRQLQSWLNNFPESLKGTNHESARQRFLLSALFKALNGEASESVKEIIGVDFATEDSVQFLLTMMRPAPVPL